MLVRSGMTSLSEGALTAVVPDPALVLVHPTCRQSKRRRGSAMPFNLSEQSLVVLFLAMGMAGALVWFAGTRLVMLVDDIAQRTGIGQAFAGMLLLGGITSLPELATASSASLAGCSRSTICLAPRRSISCCWQ
jgi:Ca2+/H+ antiporter